MISAVTKKLRFGMDYLIQVQINSSLQKNLIIWELVNTANQNCVLGSRVT